MKLQKNHQREPLVSVRLEQSTNYVAAYWKVFQLCIMYTYLGLSNVHGSMDHNQVPIIYYWYDQLQFSCFHDIMKMLDFFKVSSSTWYNNLKILIFSWEHWNCSWSCPMIDKCLFIIGWQALKLCLYFYSMYIHNILLHVWLWVIWVNIHFTY